MKLFFVFIWFIILSSSLWAHTRWIDPAPRINENLKIAPCGGVPAETPEDTWNVGDTIKLIWEEYVQHPGFFTIYLSEGDENQFQQVVEIQDSQATGFNEFDFEIPNQPCEGCIIQVIQTMLNTDPPTFYHSCSDVKIVRPIVPLSDSKNEQPNFKLSNSGTLNWNTQGDKIEFQIHQLNGYMLYKQSPENNVGVFNLNTLNLVPGIHVIEVRQSNKVLFKKPWLHAE